MRRAFSLGAAFTDIAEAECSKHGGVASEVVCMGDGLQGCPDGFYGQHFVCKDATACDSSEGETICKGPEACPTGQVRNAQGVCVWAQDADQRGKPCKINGQDGVVDDNNDCVACKPGEKLIGGKCQAAQGGFPEACPTGQIRNAQGVCVWAQDADQRGKPCKINGQDGVVDDNNDCVATPKGAADDKSGGGSGALWVAGALGLAVVAYFAMKKK